MGAMLSDLINWRTSILTKDDFELLTKINREIGKGYVGIVLDKANSNKYLVYNYALDVTVRDQFTCNNQDNETGHRQAYEKFIEDMKSQGRTEYMNFTPIAGYGYMPGKGYTPTSRTYNRTNGGKSLLNGDGGLSAQDLAKIQKFNGHY